MTDDRGRRTEMVEGTEVQSCGIPTSRDDFFADPSTSLRSGRNDNRLAWSALCQGGRGAGELAAILPVGGRVVVFT